MLRIADWTWESRATYPFADDINTYAAVVHEQMLYLFGGNSRTSGGEQSTIAQFNANTDTWAKVGALNQARSWHDATFSQGAFLIVGKGQTEKCDLTDNLMECIRQEPSITRYG